MSVGELEDYSVRTAPEGATPKKLIERAIELRPLLRDQQEETEQRGYYSTEIRDALNEAGFFAAIQPKTFGGLESPIADYYRMIVEIARGCPSTAWCYALGVGKTLMVSSFYPEEVQREIHERVGVVHGAYGPGKSSAVPVEGGFIINGTFNYCSGVPYSNHLLGTAPVNAGSTDDRVSTWAADTKTNLIEFMLPRGSYEILDDWGGGRTLGLNGSGSFSVKVENAFVPTRYTMPDVGHLRDPLRDPETGTVGTRLHGNPMYLGHLEYFLTGEITAVQVGAAQAMIDELEQAMRTKMGVRGLYGNSPATQGDFGEAVKLADGAEAILIRGAEMGAELAERWAETRRLPDPYELWKIANMFQLANSMSWDAGLIAFRQVGTSPLKRGERIQRYFRDLAQERAQATVTGRVFRDSGVRARLGLGPDGKFPEVANAELVLGATRA